MQRLQNADTPRYVGIAQQSQLRLRYVKVISQHSGSELQQTRNAGARLNVRSPVLMLLAPSGEYDRIIRRRWLASPVAQLRDVAWKHLEISGKAVVARSTA